MDLWAITCYFNPIQYRRRLANYRAFRRHLHVPLVTVELAFGADYDLSSGDADILLQLRGRDVLWQKERLLNLALQEIPAECSKVVWLDCDLIFEREDWHEGLDRLLDEFALVQPFSMVHDVPANVGLEDLARSPSSAYSFAFIRTSGKKLEPPEKPTRRSQKGALGCAWAARCEVLHQHGFYDRTVLGGGDGLMTHAAVGQMEATLQYEHMNPGQVEHYLNWAEPFFQTIAGKVGSLEGRLFHLWHGDLNNRKYKDRHRDFHRFHFDPREDIALEDNGCWRWNTAKPDMHRFVKNYFISRREDG